MILALKIALIVAVSGPLVFAADYTRLTRGACWRDPIGQTIVIKDLLLAGSLAPLLLAAFFHLSALGSEIGAWVLIGFLFLAGIAVYWRTAVFEHVNRRRKEDT
jgi:hypothetical protein